jgi:tagaturonate reductase
LLHDILSNGTVAKASNPPVISNTTESGISYLEEIISREKTPVSFPGKVLLLMQERFNKLGKDSSFDILCCELIDNNSTTLHSVLLDLAKYNNFDSDLIDYINSFSYNDSLVDRIVPGYPKDDIVKIEQENGYIDNSLVKAEPFALWVIKGSTTLKEILPFEKTDIHAYYVNDITPYKQQKVKILNGSHTALVPLSYLLGFREVKDSINNPLILKFVNLFVDNEVLPTIKLDKNQILGFKNSVIERFQNPFIHHMLLSIALNSISKYETRIIPSIEETYNNHIFPKYGLFALACLIRFYKGTDLNGDPIPLNDSPEIISYIKDLYETNDYLFIVKGITSKYYSAYSLFKDDKVINYVSETLKSIDNISLNDVLLELING